MVGFLLLLCVCVCGGLGGMCVWVRVDGWVLVVVVCVGGVGCVCVCLSVCLCWCLCVGGGWVGGGGCGVCVCVCVLLDFFFFFLILFPSAFVLSILKECARDDTTPRTVCQTLHSRQDGTSVAQQSRFKSTRSKTYLTLNPRCGLGLFFFFFRVLDLLHRPYRTLFNVSEMAQTLKHGQGINFL